MYPGPAPLLEIFLAEVSGKHIKKFMTLHADNSGKSQNSESETRRAEGDLESGGEGGRNGKTTALADNGLNLSDNSESETPRAAGDLEPGSSKGAARDGKMPVTGKLPSFLVPLRS